MFMIGFNEEQAEAFAAAWPKHNGSTCGEFEFYFCDVSAEDDPGVHQYDASMEFIAQRVSRTFPNTTRERSSD